MVSVLFIFKDSMDEDEKSIVNEIEKNADGIAFRMSAKKDAKNMYTWFAINMIFFLLSGDFFALILAVLLLALAITFSKRPSIKLLIPEGILFFLLALVNLSFFVSMLTSMNFAGILGLLLFINQITFTVILIIRYNKFKNIKIPDEKTFLKTYNFIKQLKKHLLKPKADDKYIQFTAPKYPVADAWIGKIMGEEIFMYSPTAHRFETSTKKELDIIWGKKIIGMGLKSATMNLMGKRRKVAFRKYSEDKLTVA